MDYTWDWSVIWQYRSVFLKGSIITLELTGLVILLGTVAGIFLGVLNLSQKKVFRNALLFFIDVIRALPVLIFLLWVYYFLPVLLRSDISAFWCAVVALSINLSVFVADVVRGAIEGVPKGQVEAARALGMSKVLTMRRIVLPEAIRQLVPTFTMLYITMLKFSTLASVISVYELLHSADGIISNTYKTLEVYTAVAGMFLLIILPLTYISRRMEKSKWFVRRV